MRIYWIRYPCIYRNLTSIKNIICIKNEDLFNVKNPIKTSSHINIMYGSLAPLGSVGKITGKEGLSFFGKACVYSTEDEFIHDLTNNKIKPNSVIILRYQGPKGSPGMPEMLRATSSIVGYGIKDSIAFITDGRFSGGSHGFIIGHVTPEAYDGGPIALIENDDLISINAETNEINHFVSDVEMKERRAKWVLPKNVINNVDSHSWLEKYRKLVGSASDGCVL
jgi:dihydroxy-acid dehydratase